MPRLIPPAALLAELVLVPLAFLLVPLALVLMPLDRAGLAQTLTRRELERLGVDLVEVKAGPRLRGAILDRPTDGPISIAVRRAWLKAEAPRFYEKTVETDEDAPRQQLVRLRERTAAWLQQLEQEGGDDWEGRERLVRFLTTELERIDKALSEQPPAAPADRNLPGVEPPPQAEDRPATESEFVRVTIPAAQVRRTYQQPLERRRVAAVAWRERLENVESTPAAELARALAERGIDASQEQPDLSDRLPPAADSDQQWAARRALVEYAFGRRLDFQGTGDFLVQAPQPGHPADVPALMAGMLREQLHRELGDLLQEPGLGLTSPTRPGWQETATKAAERAGLAGVRVTRVHNNLRAGRSRVDSHFLARLPDGTWQAVWHDHETVDATAANQELEQRIRDDPQFQQIEQLTGLLGGIAGNDQLRQAIRFGAATMQAQQTIEDRWWQFRERATRRLDAAWPGGGVTG